MGVGIEFDRIAVAFGTEDEFGNPEEQYLLVHQTGSDNVLDHDGTITRKWSYYTVGNEATVMADLALAAGDIESGMMRYQNGSTKIENFLKNWRQELREHASLSIDEFTSKFPVADLMIRQPDSVVELPDEVRETFETVQMTWRRTRDDSDTPVYHGDVTKEHLEQFETLSDETHVTVDFDR